MRNPALSAEFDELLARSSIAPDRKRRRWSNGHAPIVLEWDTEPELDPLRDLAGID